MAKQSASRTSDFGVKLAKPAERALGSAGITRLEQLHGLSETDLNSMHGIGPNAINALKVALKAKGKSLSK